MKFSSVILLVGALTAAAMLLSGCLTTLSASYEFKDGSRYQGGVTFDLPTKKGYAK